MKRYLLDTNICIFFLKGKYQLNENLMNYIFDTIENKKALDNYEEIK